MIAFQRGFAYIQQLQADFFLHYPLKERLI